MDTHKYSCFAFVEQEIRSRLAIAACPFKFVFLCVRLRNKYSKSVINSNRETDTHG